MKTMVYIKSYKTPKVDKKEIFRYAGVKEIDKETSLLLDRCIDESESALCYKVCYNRYKISVNGDLVDFGFTTVNSHSLALCLKDCDEIILFCATVGIGIDRLIKKYSVTSPSTAVILQALGSERVEALCDVFCQDMQNEISRELRPRFSPGYGDLPLEIQSEIFIQLEPSKIGVSLLDTLFMTPSKSVTAIIGIKKEK